MRWWEILLFLCPLASQVSTHNGTSLNATNASSAGAEKLFVLVIDGLPASITSHAAFPGLKATHPRFMLTTSPSLYLPATLSLLTGNTPERHGFTDNYLYSADSGMSFSYSNTPYDFSSEWWTDYLPIWDHLSSAGVRVGVFGSELCNKSKVLICDSHIVMIDAESIEHTLRIFHPDLDAIFAFASFTDRHEFSSKAEYRDVQQRAELRVLNMSATLKKATREHDNLNVIVTGNRGYVSDDVIYLSLQKIISDAGFNYEADLMLKPRHLVAQFVSLYHSVNTSDLKTALKDTNTQILIYSEDDMVKSNSWSYSGGRYAAPLVLSAKRHFCLTSQEDKPSRFALVEGASNLEPETRTALFAFGKEFVESQRPMPVASVVDVFALICDFFRVDVPEPSPDCCLGSYSLSHLLRRNPEAAQSHPIVVIVILALVILVFASMVVFVIVRRHKIESAYSLPDQSTGPPMLATVHETAGIEETNT